MRTLLAMVILLCAMSTSAQEWAVPDAPVQATVTEYRITSLLLERDIVKYPIEEWHVVITYRDNNGRTYTDEHLGKSTIIDPGTGQPVNNPNGADELMKFLNTANFTTTSQMRRIYQHLVQHGKIPPSTVQGAPEK